MTPLDVTRNHDEIQSSKWSNEAYRGGIHTSDEGYPESWVRDVSQADEMEWGHHVLIPNSHANPT